MKVKPVIIRTFYSIVEYGQLTGISQATIHRHIKGGVIKAVRLGGRVLIPATEVEKLKPS